MTLVNMAGANVSVCQHGHGAFAVNYVKALRYVFSIILDACPVFLTWSGLRRPGNALALPATGWEGTRELRDALTRFAASASGVREPGRGRLGYRPAVKWARSILYFLMSS